MILVDTSVWIDHLRNGSEQLRELLLGDQVLMHPFIVGELACGRLNKRDLVLGSLHELPVAAIASHEEALAFLETERLTGWGIGWIDVHLLAAARLSRALLWTFDASLAKAAGSLGVSFTPEA